MKYPFLFCLVIAGFSSNAQFYYKDIIGTKEANETIKTYKANHVSSVEIRSNDASSQSAENFVVRQIFDPAASVLKTTTQSGETASVLTTWFDEKGRVIKTADSSGSIVNTTTYTYNDKDWVISLSSTATDTLKKINETELHQWAYSGTGKPTGMKRSINGGAASEVKIILDDKGNISEEQSFKNGMNNFLYYYYDDKNQLTDIVRYNYKLKKLLPDYMFEYDEQGRVIQKIAVPVNSMEYQIWRYQFNDKGLKVKEAVFDKNKQLLGKVEYNYSFSQ